MSHQYRPGDPAMVLCSDGKERIAQYREYPLASWVFPDGLIRHVLDSEARPLVVIDPENEAQVHALVSEYHLDELPEERIPVG
jgi:hypothetical protein